MLVEKKGGVRATTYAALALAFASFGDAFLYPYLPLNFAHAGIPAVWVGVLLSLNRFIRIFSNTLVVRLIATFGLRPIVIAAASAAILSTLGYAIAHGVIAWVLFRMLWGLSFSSLRMGAVGYAIQHERAGFALAVSKSLQETGPMLALFIAPLLLHSVDSKTIFFMLAMCSLPALYFAWSLPQAPAKTQRPSGPWLLSFPTLLNATTFISAFVIDGIIVVVLGILLQRGGQGLTLMAATTLAAVYLAYRRICLVVLSICGGWISDRIGIDHVFNLSMFVVLLGLLIILSGFVQFGVVILFSFYAINSAISPGAAAAKKTHALASVAENATWRDLGAAAGTLVGGFLVFSDYTNAILTGTVAIMSVLVFLQSVGMHKGIAHLLSWRARWILLKNIGMNGVFGRNHRLCSSKHQKNENNISDSSPKKESDHSGKERRTPCVIVLRKG